MVTRLDKFGRIIIPKKFRERLGIKSKSTLNISEDGKRIVIELVQEKETVIDRNEILVFTGNLENKKNDLVKTDRNKRMHKLFTFGKLKINC